MIIWLCLSIGSSKMQWEKSSTTLPFELLFGEWISWGTQHSTHHFQLQNPLIPRLLIAPMDSPQLLDGLVCLKCSSKATGYDRLQWIQIGQQSLKMGQRCFTWWTVHRYQIWKLRKERVLLLKIDYQWLLSTVNKSVEGSGLWRNHLHPIPSFFHTQRALREQLAAGSWSLGRLRVIHEVVVIQAALGPQIPGSTSWQCGMCMAGPM